MKRFFAEHKWQLLFFALTGAVGGWFTGAYSIETLAPDMKALVIAQMGSETAALAVAALQTTLYGLVLGAIGIRFAEKLGLWRPMALGAEGLKAAGIVSVIGGLALIGLDVLVFGRFDPWVASGYAAKPTLAYCIGSVTYGGVIEEVMMRLFLMSLLALLFWKLLARGQTQCPEWACIAANVTTALLFAAGHLPATMAATTLTPMILLRCFLLNGGVGLLLGRLYRRHGIQYAMAAHAGCHVVSKLIWFLFV